MCSCQRAVNSCTRLGIWVLYIMLTARMGSMQSHMPAVCCMRAALVAEAGPMLGAHVKLSHLTLRCDFHQQGDQAMDCCSASINMSMFWP